MARFRFSRFSRRAEADLLSIGDYTLRTWGKTQAAHYIGESQVCCQTLANNPALGRLCDDVRPDLHRLEHGQHVDDKSRPRGLLSGDICADRDPMARCPVNSYAASLS